ncbi:MAG: hypothetical protein M3O46_14025 [Myxococcota bacterium]|nr:hypothetical protein [Myxococcota bacterium]
MHRYRSIRWPLVITLAVLSFSATARANEISSDTNSPRRAVDGDYGYVFSDDPMQAGAFTPTDARITVSRHVVRTQLIRPRRAFVVEMLRSVETL